MTKKRQSMVNEGLRIYGRRTRPLVKMNIFGEREWEYRCNGVKDGIAMDNLSERDEEVFRTINEEVAEREREKGEYEVYMGIDEYRRLKFGSERGLSGRVLCAYAEISMGRYRLLKEKYVKLGERLEEMREKLVGCALLNLSKSVIEEGDVKNSKWVLERLDRDRFGKNGSSVSGSVEVRHTLDLEKIKEIRGELLRSRDASIDLSAEGYHDMSAKLEDMERKREEQDKKGVIDV